MDVGPRDGGSQPTYEELKRYVFWLYYRAAERSQPTYEELKHQHV